MISKDVCGNQEPVDVWAARLQRWGMGEFVPFATEILRPFGFLGAQALHLFAPVLSALSSPAEINRLADLLESPEALDRLSDTLRVSPPDQD